MCNAVYTVNIVYAVMLFTHTFPAFSFRFSFICCCILIWLEHVRESWEDEHMWDWTAAVINAAFYNNHIGDDVKVIWKS